MSKFLKDHWHHVFAFLLPIVLMLLIYITFYIYPFGEGSVLVLDLNGQYVSYYLHSEQVTQLPVNEVRLQGTLVIPGVGTGKFRWPCDNPRITCTVGCYAGHRAVDIVNIYQRYGNVYAADRGTVETTGYNQISGYYVIINHNNGLRSYYGHMNKPSFVEEGTNVDRGEVIGQIGQTGVATGPHIHFYIVKNDGTRPHPCSYLGCRY